MWSSSAHPSLQLLLRSLPGQKPWRPPWLFFLAHLTSDLSTYPLGSTFKTHWELAQVSLLPSLTLRTKPPPSLTWVPQKFNRSPCFCPCSSTVYLPHSQRDPVKTQVRSSLSSAQNPPVYLPVISRLTRGKTEVFRIAQEVLALYPSHHPSLYSNQIGFLPYPQTHHKLPPQDLCLCSYFLLDVQIVCTPAFRSFTCHLLSEICPKHYLKL